MTAALSCRETLRTPDSITGWVLAQARRRPSSVALSWPGGSATYAELDLASAGMAARLRSLGVRPGDVVPVRLPRGPALVAAVLGVLRAGAAYVGVPLDWPASRLRSVAASADVRLAVSDVDAGWPCPVVGAPLPLATWARWGSYTADRSPDDAACVFFTSGSTGEPKGALCPDRAVVDTLRSGGVLTAGPDVVTVQVCAPAWDAFAGEVWTPLLHGGRLVLPAPGAFDAASLRTAVADGVTSLILPTSLFHTLVDADVAAFAGLREVMVAGERMSAAHARRFLAAHPELPLRNGYGPVETMLIDTARRVVPADVSDPCGVPIGTAIPGSTVELPGGEIVIGGDGVAYGYLGLARETARRFVPVAGGARAYRTGDLGSYGPDGVLRYGGRADRQVKLRGTRIEPGEVEAALRECPGVLTAVVVPRRLPDGRVTGLHGWFTGAGDPDDVRAALATRVPAALRPAVLTRLDALPLNGSGKADVRALEARAASAPALDDGPAPAGPEEAAVLAAAATVLDLPRLDLSFAACGGDSLSAILLAQRLTEATGRSIRAVDVLTSPTLASLAVGTAAAPAPVAEAGDLTPGQRLFWPAELIAPGEPALRVWRAAVVHGPLDVAGLEAALVDVARAHPALCRVLAAEDDPTPYEIAAAEAFPLVELPDVASLDELLARPEPWQVSLAGPQALAAVARCSPSPGGPDGWAVVVMTHHAVTDGWSTQVLLDDLAEAYEARARGARPDLRPETAAYVEQPADLDFWRDELAGLTQPTWPGTPRGDGLHAHDVELDLRRLTARIADEGATVSAALLAAVVHGVGAVAGADEVCVGVPTAGRDEPGLDRTVGYLTGVLPVRVTVHADDPVKQLLAARDALHRALRHRAPFDAIVAAVGPDRDGRPPLCAVSMARQLQPDMRITLPGLAVEQPPPPPSGGMFELTLELWPDGDDAWTGSVQHQRAAVPDDAADAVREHLTDYLRRLGEADSGSG